MNCLTQAIAAERIHQVRLLLSMNVDCTIRDRRDYNRTPLIKCCQVPSEEASLKLLKILMRFKININERDNLGRTALHYVCETGKEKVAEVLMNEDAVELNGQDHDGKTPLMLACMHGHLKLSLALLRKLIKFDLDVNLRDKYGYTALLLAIKNEHYDVSHDLIKCANACTTLQDDEFHMNASDWLRKNLESRKKQRSPRRRHHGRKSVAAGRLHQAIIEKQDENEEDMENDEGSGNDTTRETSSSHRNEYTRNESARRNLQTAPANLLETDPYSNSTRPISSFSKASSLARFSASSRKNPSKQLGQVYEDKTLTLPTEPLAQENIQMRTGENYSVVSFGTARSKVGEDLESISEYPYDEERNSPIAAEEMPANIPSRKPDRKTPTTVYGSSPTPKSKRRLQLEEQIEKAADDVYAIQKLKQALRDKYRRKLTRVGTAQFRPISGTPSEQWMPTVLSKNKPAQTSARNSPSKGLASRERSGVPKSTAVTIRGTSAMDLLHAESNLSINTLLTSTGTVTDTTYMNFIKPLSKRTKNAGHLDVLFKLYADSCLWKPKQPKPDSLSVKPPTEGAINKYTLDSEGSGSTIMDMNASQFGDGPPTSARPKLLKGKSRLTSGSAKSSRIGTASNRSNKD